MGAIGGLGNQQNLTPPLGTPGVTPPAVGGVLNGPPVPQVGIAGGLTLRPTGSDLTNLPPMGIQTPPPPGALPLGQGGPTIGQPAIPGQPPVPGQPGQVPGNGPGEKGASAIVQRELKRQEENLNKNIGTFEAITGAPVDELTLASAVTKLEEGPTPTQVARQTGVSLREQANIKEQQIQQAAMTGAAAPDDLLAGILDLQKTKDQIRQTTMRTIGQTQTISKEFTKNVDQNYKPPKKVDMSSWYEALGYENE